MIWSRGALLIHRFLASSAANGPGTRSVIWTQGCSLGCPGCFNPETHSGDGGAFLTIDEILHRLLKLGQSVEGLTITGGEPLQQMPGVLSLLQGIRRATRLSTVLLTGYTLPEVRAMTGADELLGALDVLIAGRYQERHRVARGLLGSQNKALVCLTPRYSAADFAGVPEAELVIDSSGTVISTGIDPVMLEARASGERR